MEMHKKLKFTEKLSYGIADLPEAANSIIAAFLTMFYTDIFAEVLLDVSNFPGAVS